MAITSIVKKKIECLISGIPPMKMFSFTRQIELVAPESPGFTG